MIKSLLKEVLPLSTRLLLRKIFYFGTTYKCNVCNSFVRTFYSAGYESRVLVDLDVIGGEHRSNDTCPVCWSHSRTRLVYHYLINEQEIHKRHARVLHIAPEKGIALFFLKQNNIEYVSADLDAKRYKDIGITHSVNVTDMAFPGNSFDVVICNHVLEHIEDDRLAMTEIFRVLKQHGWAILQVPISANLQETFEDVRVKDPDERERCFGQRDHVRIYARDFLDRLADVGFSVETFDPAEKWGLQTIGELKLNPREQVFIGHKP